MQQRNMYTHFAVKITLNVLSPFATFPQSSQGSWLATKWHVIVLLNLLWGKTGVFPIIYSWFSPFQRRHTQISMICKIVPHDSVQWQFDQKKTWSMGGLSFKPLSQLSSQDAAPMGWIDLRGGTHRSKLYIYKSSCCFNFFCSSCQSCASDLRTAGQSRHHILKHKWQRFFGWYRSICLSIFVFKWLPLQWSVDCQSLAYGLALSSNDLIKWEQFLTS